MTTASSIYERLPRQLNVAEALLGRNLAAGRGGAPAHLDDERSCTWGELHRRVCGAAGLLRAQGVNAEERVAILLPDGLELVEAFWGAIWLGAVPVPINPACKPDDLRYILADCRARLLVSDARGLGRLGDPASPWLRGVVEARPGAGLPAGGSAVERPAPTCKDEAAFWLYTSGSTGRPKGVIHAHHDMIVCAERYAVETLQLQASDRIYSVAKAPFAYGLGNSVYFPAAVGAASILSDADNAFQIIADIRRYRPTVLFAIPSVYRAILAVETLRPADAACLRLCVSAAEQLPAALWTQWKETYGLEICEGTGTTEMLHIFLSNRPGRCRPGSSGWPVPGYRVSLLDGEGREVGDGTPGVLRVQGESLMLGYWNRHAETVAALEGEAMRTGDLYRRDADGSYCFVGRTDDLFKVSGQWIAPREIEEVVLQHPAVAECAVTHRLDGGLAQVVAYFAIKPEAEPAAVEESVRSFCRSRLAGFKVPRKLYRVPALPRTSTGKVDRKQLRALP